MRNWASRSLLLFTFSLNSALAGAVTQSEPLDLMGAQSAAMNSAGPRPDSFFQGLLYSDIRDLANASYNKIELVGAANLLMRVMAASPEKFVGAVDANGNIDANQSTQIRFLPEGPTGPSGHKEMVANKVRFIVDKSNEETIKNSILGVDVEKVTEILNDPVNGAKIADLNLILFVRDDSRPSSFIKTDANGVATTIEQPFTYYFRRMAVRVDWTRPQPDSNRVIIKGVTEPDIPLNDTSFEVYVSLLDRKAVLLDRKHMIRKTFPIGASSLEIHSPNTSYELLDYPATDDSGNLITDANGDVKHYPSVRRVKNMITTMTGEYPSAFFTKASVWKTETNTRSRTWPAYYNGRPFLGLRQNVGKSAEYDGIAMHYQIDPVLHRGFISHGCMRVADKNLYQLDAIVNDGPNDRTPVQVLNTLDSYFDQFEPIMPREDDSYNAMVFTDTPTEGWVSCKALHLDQVYTVRTQGSCASPNSDGSCSVKNFISAGMHTITDEDCLNGLFHFNTPVTGLISYMRGQGGELPRVPFVSGLQHKPLLIEGVVTEAPTQIAQENEGMTSEGGDEGFNILNIFGGGKRNQRKQPQTKEVQQTMVKAQACMDAQAQYLRQQGCGRKTLLAFDNKAKACNKAWDNYNSCKDIVHRLAQ